MCTCIIAITIAIACSFTSFHSFTYAHVPNVMNLAAADEYFGPSRTVLGTSYRPVRSPQNADPAVDVHVCPVHGTSVQVVGCRNEKT